MSPLDASTTSPKSTTMWSRSGHAYCRLYQTAASSSRPSNSRIRRYSNQCGIVLQFMALTHNDSSSARMVARSEYLAPYQQVDIALDPFPYPGITTTVESLWMGVPVLTLEGKSFISRQGVGLSMNAGLASWIARDHDDYVALAVKHAARPQCVGLGARKPEGTCRQLADFRQSPLCRSFRNRPA